MGDIISSSHGRTLVKAASNGFGAAKRQRFLDALASTCNITKSAAFAGIALSTVHRARVRDAVFAAQWHEALAIGYDRLEGLVLEHGGAGVAIAPEPDRAAADGMPVEPFDFARAMEILKYRRAAREGRTVQTGRPVRNASREETTEALLKALAAARRRVAAREA